MSEIKDMVQALVDQARVHDRNPRPCIGLPYCVSCRSAVLLKNKMDTVVAEAWIQAQEPGLVVRWDD